MYHLIIPVTYKFKPSKSGGVLMFIIIKAFLFTLLFSLTYLENTNAYVENSSITTNTIQQEFSPESETFQLEQITEQKNAHQRRRGHRGRRYRMHEYDPYCNYLPQDLPWEIHRPLLTAICDGANIPYIRDLIYNYGHSPYQRWLTGETPLMIAAQTGNFRLVRILVIEFGVSLITRDRWGHTAANWAYENDYDLIGDYLCNLR